MIFPDFEDFLDTLTEERLNEIFADFKKVDVIELKSRAPENISAFITHLRHDTLGISVSLTLRMLEAYHEWLSTQIQQ